MSRSLAATLALGIIGSFLLIFFAQPIAHFFASSFFDLPQIETPPAQKQLVPPPATTIERKIVLSEKKTTPPAPETTVTPLPTAVINPEPVTLPSAKAPGPLPDKLKTGDTDTLSSQYIVGVLSAQTASLRRCQTNSLRDNQVSVGNFLLSLTIQPNGRINNVKVLQDDTANENLKSCVVSIIERTVFKNFNGLPITITYPIEFR